MSQYPLPPALLTKAELKGWLRVSDFWVRDRLKDPQFVAACVVDLAPEDSPRRTLRFSADGVATLLGIPTHAEPATAAA